MTYGAKSQFIKTGAKKANAMKTASSSTACQSVVIRFAKECRRAMKPSHCVNSAPQLLQRMLRMRPGVARIQRWRIIRQESVERQ
jgi:hypothetical protein